MKFCKMCGTQLKDDAVFCPQCGARISAPAPVQAPEPVPAPAPAPTPAPASFVPPVGSVPVKKSKKGLVIAIIAVVLLLAATAALFFLKGKDSQEEPVKTEPPVMEAETEPETEAEETETIEKTTEETSKAAETTEAVTEAETTAEQTKVAITVDDFLGDWGAVGGRWGLTISRAGEGYIVNMEGSSGAASGGYSVMHCFEENGKLQYNDEVSSSYEFDMQTGKRTDTINYTDGCGYFELTTEKPESWYERTASYEYLAKEWTSDTDWTADLYLCWYREEGLKNTAILESILPYSSERLLSEEDLAGLTKEELRIARNEIYARHGRKFTSDDLRQYFESCSWYNGTIEASAFNDNVLSDIEKKNVAIIESRENGSGATAYYDFSCRVYDGRYGVIIKENNGSVLTVEGMINGVYQEKTFRFDKNTVFTSIGGEDPEYEISGAMFCNTVNSYNGLGIEITEVNGVVTKASLCS